MNAGGKASTVALKAGGFYTLVFGDSSDPIVFKDSVSTNRTKAQMTFYNLSKLTLDLKTADGKVAVIAGLKPGASAAREINPVKIAFGVFQGGELLEGLNAVQLERGAAYSVFQLEKKTVWVQNTTDKSLR